MALELAAIPIIGKFLAKLTNEELVAYLKEQLKEKDLLLKEHSEKLELAQKKLIKYYKNTSQSQKESWKKKK